MKTLYQGSSVRRFSALLLLVAGLSLPFGVFAETGAVQPGDAEAGLRLLEQLQSGFNRVAETVIPSVVQIDVVDVVQAPVATNPFEYFFGQGGSGRTRDLRQSGLGSGVIISQERNTVLVLTNAHVAGKAEEISVRLNDGRSFPAELVGSDERKDIALVRFESSDKLPVAVLGSSDRIKVGDWVLAIGSPLGFTSSMTSGIVSAVGRHAASNSGVADFTDYIQTDAAINQGNSGGPLVNLRGEVVGINTWIASTSGGSIGIGFAVPIDSIRETVRQLAEKGEVEYGWLGAYVSDVMAGSGSEQGAFISNIFAGSPADRAGLLPGDVVTSINSSPVNSANDLIRIVGNTSPGTALRFAVERNGEKRQLSVRIQKRGSGDSIEAENAGVWPGFMAAEDQNGAVRVVSVLPDSPAALSGFQNGDIIVRINNNDIKNLTDFIRYLGQDLPRGEDEYRFRIQRNGVLIIIPLIKPE